VWGPHFGLGSSSFLKDALVWLWSKEEPPGFLSRRATFLVSPKHHLSTSLFLLDRCCSQRCYELPLLSFFLSQWNILLRYNESELQYLYAKPIIAINIEDGKPMEEATVQEPTEVRPLGRAHGWND
jgi:hypothetical protein